ncbi:Chemotaxis protein CheD [Candidatus Burkholderia verschuerenii]|uniref:Probable chemoreceptor glutamine deamidase CheD n=1 Tax=Candidatus Burkholderia verschuerenii TaxID=242163 RepID=A0A0L0MGA5_9BURK|nr:chemoreceptor glutamine deamidase CheD [Candidatus Burkholderia verschuerenii]KND61336.1 Chemotaxis protein CheD [Candidatus Burkholderia verschuerenii]
MSGLPIASNLYFDNHFKKPGVKLLPNEFYMTSEDMVLVTVLGSCVAACINDRTAGIGGMNHFMLPDDGADASSAASDSMRYGAYAMEVLINEMIKRGGRRERFEAKVFGGGAVLTGMTTINIGDRNSEFVRRYLALEKIRITAEDLQGMYPRKVAFMPRTGQVMVKKLMTQHDPVVLEREQALVQRTPEQRAERLAKARARVELFNTHQTKPTAAASIAAKPRVELFGASHAANAAAAASKATASTLASISTATSRAAVKPRVELFGNGPRGAKAAEEA